MEHETFQYTYCAKQQEEIKAIREKYMTPDREDKLERLRRLDAGATRKACGISLTVGVIGALLLGSGMSLSMSEFGQRLGLRADTAMLIGVGIGVAGIVLVCLAYPLYNRTVKRERKKIAPEILRLTDELMK